MFQNPYASLMGQNPYYNQPMNNQQFLPQEQPQALIRVNGIDGAKAYQMPANSTVALFDSNNDIMYVKTTDGAGFPSIRTFSFSEIKQDTTQEIKQDYNRRFLMLFSRIRLILYRLRSISFSFSQLCAV